MFVNRLSSASFLAIALSLSLSTQAMAEEADEPRSDDIIVTGERVERSLQDTPASVTVIDLGRLEERSTDNVSALLAEIANVQLGAGDQGPTIRGQDTTGVLQGADAFLGGSRPRTTVSVDGRALGYNEFIYGLSSLWDVERVEIFRTPQTTTQGRNSTAGAIFVTTIAPTFEPEARFRGGIGNYDTRQLSAALSGPIIADQVAARIAVDWRERQSSSITPLLIPGLDQRADNFTNVRGRVRIQPTALPDLMLDIGYTHLETEAPQSDTVRPPFNARRNDVGGGGYFRTNIDALTGMLSYDLSRDIDLRITPTYTWSRIDRLAESGGGDARIDAREFTIEGVLSANLSEAARATAGVYFLDASQREFIDLSLFLGVGNFTDEQTSFGLFSEVEVDILPRLRVTLGGRYQRDAQDRDGFLGTPAFGLTVDYDRSFDAFLPKASIAYDISDDVNVGLLAQRAFNPGGTTISFVTGDADEFGAETLWNYEVFVRSTTLDGRLRVNANLFYTDFTNAQRFTTTVVTLPGGGQDIVTDIGNVPAARSYGFEFDTSFQISPRLRIGGSVGLLNTRITRTLDALDPVRGRDFQRAPKFSAGANIAWEIIDGLQWDVQVRRNSRYFSDDANTPALVVNGSTNVDTKLSYTMGAFTLSAYARNLFDEFALTNLYAPDFGTPDEPRQYGVTLEARF
jgi:iron complex outermembrane recepter protein